MNNTFNVNETRSMDNACNANKFQGNYDLRMLKAYASGGLNIMHSALFRDGIKSGLHWGAPLSDVHRDTLEYILGVREFKRLRQCAQRKSVQGKRVHDAPAQTSGFTHSRKKASFFYNNKSNALHAKSNASSTYLYTEKRSIIDLDKSFQGLRRVITYINALRYTHTNESKLTTGDSSPRILCIIDNSLPPSVASLLKYTAVSCDWSIVTGKQAQEELRNSPHKYGGLFIIGGYNSGRVKSIIAARNSGIPVISIVNTSANLQGITYPILINTTSIQSLHYLLSLLTHSLIMLRVKE